MCICFGGRDLARSGGLDNFLDFSCNRATVQFMNVTIKIDDGVCRAARHRAVDRGLSLSGWITELIQEVVESEKETETLGLLEALAMEDGDEKEFVIPRDADSPREVSFS